jgi:hypothetical protein
MDHLVEGAKVYFYRPPSVLDVVKKTRKAKHNDHYVGPAVIIKKIRSRSFQISYTDPFTGKTQPAPSKGWRHDHPEEGMAIPLSCSR